jgi:hypothetical protein
MWPIPRELRSIRVYGRDAPTTTAGTAALRDATQFSFWGLNAVLSFRAMSGANLSNPTPQFGTAEYVGAPGNDHCQFCHQPIAGTYYRANDAMACPGCAEKMRGELARDTHAAYMRGLLYGIGAAIVGLILYATFEIMSGIIIGYASLAVGWLVGKAIMKGSGGVGGRRYQITAAVLTYAAVAMAAVPVWIHFAGQQRAQHSEQQAEQRPHEAGPQPSEPGQESQAQRSKRPRMSRGEAIARLALYGIASPMVEVWKGGPSFGWMIGLVILFVGINIAWKITAGRPLEIYGPFENTLQSPR